jgi:hypothetical protein
MFIRRTTGKRSYPFPHPFVVYRIVLGVVVLSLLWTGVLHPPQTAHPTRS